MDKGAFDTINWSAHSAVNKSHNAQRIHFTKNLHEVLPTNYNLHRRSPERQQCPSCDDTKEDHDHIIRCQSPARATWRAETMVKIQEACIRIRTATTMTQILSQGLHGWFRHQNTLSPDAFPHKYHRLIRLQNQIGWRQLFHGRFVTEWARLHDDYTYNASQNPTWKYSTGTYKRTGDQWCQAITTVLWAQWTLVWALRNAVIHGKDEITRRRCREQEDLRQLQQMYSQRPLMEPRVQDLLFDTVEEHEQLPAHLIHNWIAIHATLVQQSIKQASARAIQGVLSIRNYFQPSQDTT